MAPSVYMSSTPLSSSLARIFEAASAHVRLLRDAHLRPEIDRARLSESSLELLIGVIATQAARLRSDPALTADLREEVETLVAAERALRADFVPVQTHLLDLAAQWRCGACQGEVPGAALVTPPFTSARDVSVALECQQCGARTALTPAGRDAFARWFGDLVRPGWQPALNGFLVDGGSDGR